MSEFPKEGGKLHFHTASSTNFLGEKVNGSARATQLGVVSRGEECAAFNSPGIYTRFVISLYKGDM